MVCSTELHMQKSHGTQSIMDFVQRASLGASETIKPQEMTSE